MFKHLSIEDFLAWQGDTPAVVDIRDPGSFAAGRIDAATPLDQSTLPTFMAETPKEKPVVVCCYHGNSSQQAAEFLSQQGYADVYSLDGGFEAFKVVAPDRVSAGND